MDSLTSVQAQVNVRVRLGKVLLVEDEALTREAIARFLADEGFEVCIAENGQRALDMLLGAQQGSAQQGNSHNGISQKRLSGGDRGHQHRHFRPDVARYERS